MNKLLIPIICVMLLCGCSKSYVEDLRPPMEYKKFFKEVRGTDSPIVHVWIEHGCLYVETEDGNLDCQIIKIGRRQ